MGVLERSGRGRLVVAAVVALGLAGAALGTWWRASRPTPASSRARPVPDEGDRVVVEVLNTTPSVGLARAATRLLRDAGLDVVYYGSETGAALDTTEVLIRRGPSLAAERVARVLGLGVVRMAPDGGRLVDVTVRLGRDFNARRRVPVPDP